MRATASDILRQNPIFEPASDAALATLVARCELAVYPAGTLIHSAGDPAKHLYALGRGMVRVFHRSDQGSEIIVKLFGGPTFFGEGEVFAKIPWLVGLAAVEPSEMVHVPPAPLLSFLRQQPECAVRMLIDVGNRLAVSCYLERSLAFDPSTVRLANYLLDYASWTNRPDATAWRIDLTQEQMAGAIGVTRRSVAKDIAAWQQEGIIERRAHGYEVVKLDALRGYADPDRLALSYRLRASWAEQMLGTLPDPEGDGSAD